MKPIRAIILLTLTLLLVLFFEAPRVERYITNDQSALARLAGPYLSWSKSVLVIFSLDRTTTLGPGGNATTTPPAVVIPRFTAPEPPYRVLMVGDSFIAERFGVQLARDLETRASTTVSRRGVYSTGLSRPDYFDWEKELSAKMAETSPNVLVVMFGANDAQDIRERDGRITLRYGTPEWDSEYLARIRAFVAPATEQKIMIFWIGNPVARDAYYRDRMAHLNGLYASALAPYPNARFISTWELLRDANGNYANYLPNAEGQMRLARTSDGIHVTDFGATFIVDAVMNALRRELILEKMDLPQ